MDGPQTLDLLTPLEVVERLLAAEERVVPAVRAAAPAIAAAAELVADCVVGGGRLVLAGAGTSGRLAVAEAAELPGTFGLPAERVVGVLAGGGRQSLAGTDADEDDDAAAELDLAGLLERGDVLVAVAASGRTPYTVQAARLALAAGASVVAVVTSTGSPLAAMATVAVEPEIGDEVLRGSTRLAAGTAQKVALNALTTAAMTRAGRVHGDLMVDVVAANAKLRERSAGIVAEIAGVDPQRARAALQACRWNARAAVLHLAVGLPPEAAAAHAQAHASLRDALAISPEAARPRISGPAADPSATPATDWSATPSAGRPPGRRPARPRDELGRPLPYGSPGVERQPEGVVRTAAQTLAEARLLFSAGRPFHAHEVFEDAWKNGPEDERELWRGLAQLAVGATHAARGNRRGATALLDRGAGALEPFAGTRPHGLDVEALRRWAEESVRAAAAADQGPLRLPPPPLG